MMHGNDNFRMYAKGRFNRGIDVQGFFVGLDLDPEWWEPFYNYRHFKLHRLDIFMEVAHAL